MSNGVAKTRRETHALAMIYMALMNLDATGFLSRVLWDVDSLHVPEGRWRELYRMDSGEFYPGADPLSVQWLEDVDWGALPGGPLGRVSRAVGGDFDSAVYQPVFWRVVLREWLDNLAPAPFEFIGDGAGMGADGGFFAGDALLPIATDRAARVLRLTVGGGEGLMDDFDAFEELDGIFPNDDLDDPALDYDDLLPSRCND